MLRTSLTVARRDFAGLYLSPIALFVGVTFWVLQGLSFFSIVKVLADPKAVVGYGAVLRTLFGGTMIYWSVVFSVVSLTTMSLIAGEKQSNQWELTATTRAAMGSIVFGKWLAAWLFYATLFLPTLLYPVILYWLAPLATPLELGPILSSYFGVLVSGVLLIAVGVLCSSVSPNQIVSAAICLGSLFVLLLAGENLSNWTPLRLFSLRGFLQDCADGLVRLDGFAVLILFGGACIAFAAGVLERQHRSWRRAFLGIAPGILLLFIGMEVGALSRHYQLEYDVTRNRRHSLADNTLQQLAKVDKELSVLVVEPGQEDFREIFRLVRGVLDRMEERQPLLAQELLDPVLEPTRVEQLAREFALPPADIADGGAVAFRYGDRSHIVDLLDMASFSNDDLGRGTVAQFRAEDAFARAIGNLVQRKTSTICHNFTASETRKSEFADFFSRLENSGYLLRSVPAWEGLDSCDAVLFLGAQNNLGAEGLKRIDRFVSSGGGLFVSLDTRLEDEQDPLPNSGLEAVLEKLGISSPPLIVVDPSQETGSRLTWMTSEGYGPHPISKGFVGRRMSVWPEPRLVLGGESLVFGSPSSWAESNIAALVGDDEEDASEQELTYPPSVAAAVEKNRSRIVVFGSTKSLTEFYTKKGITGASALATASFSWLLRRSPPKIGDGRKPERLRLLTSERQRNTVFAFVVFLLPLGLGLVFWFALNRRRQRR